MLLTRSTTVEVIRCWTGLERTNRVGTASLGTGTKARLIGSDGDQKRIWSQNKINNK